MLIICPTIERGHVLKIDPPALGDYGSCGPPPEPPKIEVETRADGAIIVNGKSIQPFTALALEAELTRLLRAPGAQNSELRLQADEETRQKDLVAVIDAACGVGIREVKIMPLRH